MTALIISFTTRPNEGSEGGVGWNFLLAAAQLAQSRAIRVHAIIDERDADSVRAAIALTSFGQFLELHPVAIPTQLRDRFGASRSRGSYLAWYPGAFKLAVRLHREHSFTTAHQVTFATATLPPVLPRSLPQKIWGPLAVASQPLVNAHGRVDRSDAMQTAIAKKVGIRFATYPDICLVQNRLTARALHDQVENIIVEPNIVVEPDSAKEPIAGKLVFAGNLIDRKRPWILLQVLKTHIMRDFVVEFVGDGPLRGSLESFTRQERLDNRVNFRGRVTREESLDIISSSSALVLPSSREGAPWVVGEAAARGVPSVVSDISGAGTVVELSGMGVEIVENSDPIRTINEFRCGILKATENPDRTPTSRWSAARLPNILDDIWN